MSLINKGVTILLLFTSLALSAQNINYSLPEGYEDVVSKEEYKFLVDESIKIISENYQISSVNQGVIELEEGQDYTALNLHNLILKCAEIEKKFWKELILSHFSSMKESMEKQKSLDLYNFESLKDFLSIRIYQESFVNQNGGSQSLVTKENLEGTISMLMLDLPSAFTPIQREIFELWDKSIDEVFQIAQRNVNKQEFVKMSESFEINDQLIEVGFIENEDYGASLALDLVSNAPEFLGEWGSVVAIPNKGLVNICRVSKENPLDFVLFIQKFKPAVEQFHSQHPQPVSPDFFWYYQGKFTRISVIENDDEINVISPMGLVELMSNEN